MQHVYVTLILGEWISSLLNYVLDHMVIAVECSEVEWGKTVSATALRVQPVFQILTVLVLVHWIAFSIFHYVLT